MFRHFVQHGSLPAMLLGALTIAAFFGCSSNTERDVGGDAVPVKTVPVVHREVSRRIVTSGLLSTESESRLSFKIGGIISEILVDEGDDVDAGDVLARLDLSEIRAEVARARSARDKADRDRRRIEKLYADSVATLEQLQDATTALDVAASGLRVAEFNLKHAVIRAPARGTVLQRFAESSELVSAGMPVFLFGAVGESWIVRVGVTDRDVLSLREGDPAVATFDAHPGIDFPAVVSEIAGFADPLSGTYEVELLVDSGGHRLFSGFVARVEIVPSAVKRYAVIPIEALVGGDGDRGFVFTPAEDGETVRKIPVRVGMVLGHEVGIVSGLEGVRTIVTAGSSYLMEGTPIRVVTEE